MVHVKQTVKGTKDQGKTKLLMTKAQMSTNFFRIHLFGLFTYFFFMTMTSDNFSAISFASKHKSFFMLISYIHVGHLFFENLICHCSPKSSFAQACVDHKETWQAELVFCNKPLLKSVVSFLINYSMISF